MCVRGANTAQNAAASKLCTSSSGRILLVVWVLLQIGPGSKFLTGYFKCIAPITGAVWRVALASNCTLFDSYSPSACV